MADILFRLKLDSKQFESKIRDVGKNIPPAELPVQINASQVQSEINKIKANLSIKSVTNSGDLAKVADRLGDGIKGSIKSGLSGAGNLLGDEITKSIEKLKPRSNIFSGLFNAISAPFRTAISGAIEGIGVGFTLPLGEKIGAGITKGIESELSEIIGSFDLVGRRIGESLAQGMQEVLVANKQIDKVRQSTSNFLGFKNIVTEAGSAKLQQKQETTAKQQQAEQFFLKEQRNLEQQRPELFGAEQNQIANARKDLVNEYNRIVERNQKNQSRGTQKRLAELKRKAANKQITEAESTELNDITQGLLAQSQRSNKRIAEIQQRLAEFDQYEKDINAELAKPQRALAALGNKTAERLQAVQNQVNILNSQKVTVLKSLEQTAQVAQSQSRAVPERLTALQEEFKKTSDKLENQRKNLAELGQLRKQAVDKVLNANSPKQVREGKENLSKVDSLIVRAKSDINNLISKEKAIAAQFTSTKKVVETRDSLKVEIKRIQEQVQQRLKTVEDLNAYEKSVLAQLNDDRITLSETEGKLEPSITALDKEKTEIKSLLAKLKVKQDQLLITQGKVPQTVINNAANQVKAINNQIKSASNKAAGLQEDLLIPPEIVDPQEKQQYLKDRQKVLTNKEIRKTEKRETQGFDTVRRAIADRNRNQKLLTQAESVKTNTLKLGQTVEKLQIEQEEAVKAALFIDEQIEKLEERLKNSTNLLSTIKKASIQAGVDVKAGIITPEVGKQKADNLSALQRETIATGAGTERQLKQKRQERKLAASKVKELSGQVETATSQRDAAVSFLESPEGRKALQAIVIYREWVDQATKTIKNEEANIKAIQKRKQELVAGLANLESGTITPQELANITRVSTKPPAKSPETQLSAKTQAEIEEIKSQVEQRKKLVVELEAFKKGVLNQVNLDQISIAEAEGKIAPANQQIERSKKEVTALLQQLKEKSAQATKVLKQPAKTPEKVAPPTKAAQIAAAERKKVAESLDPTYKLLAEQVVKLSGQQFDASKLPALIKSDITKIGEGLTAVYKRGDNTLHINPQSFEQIKNGTFTSDVINLLIHELRHAIQFNFGQNPGAKGFEFIKGSEPELKQLTPRINASVGAVKQQAPNLSEADLAVIKKAEEDAYVFADRYTKHIQDILKSAASPQFQKRIAELQKEVLSRVKTPALPPLTLPPPVESTFKNAQELKQLLNKDFNSNQIRELARSLGVSKGRGAGSETKALLTAQLSAIYGGTAESRQKIASELAKLTPKSNKPVLAPLPDEKQVIKKLKENRAAIASVLGKIAETQIKDQQAISSEVIEKANEQLKFIEQIRSSFKLSQGKSFGGITSQLQSLLQEAKAKQTEIENQLAKNAGVVEKPASLQADEGEVSLPNDVKLFGFVPTPNSEIEAQRQRQALIKSSLPLLQFEIDLLKSRQAVIRSSLPLLQFEIQAQKERQSQIRQSLPPLPFEVAAQNRRSQIRQSLPPLPFEVETQKRQSQIRQSLPSLPFEVELQKQRQATLRASLPLLPFEVELQKQRQAQLRASLPLLPFELELQKQRQAAIKASLPSLPFEVAAQKQKQAQIRQSLPQLPFEVEAQKQQDRRDAVNREQQRQSAIAASLPKIPPFKQIAVDGIEKELQDLAKQLNVTLTTGATKAQNFQKLRDLENEITNIDPVIQKRLKQLEAEVELERAANSVGLKGNKKKPTKTRQEVAKRQAELELEIANKKIAQELGTEPTKAPAPIPLSVDEELNKLKATTSQKQPSVQKVVKDQISQIRRSIANAQDKFIQSLPTALAVPLNNAQASVTDVTEAGKAAAANIPTRVNNLVRSSLLKFSESIGKSASIKALEIAKQVTDNLATAEKAVGMSQRANQVLGQLNRLPKFLQQRSDNAVFTKSRYIFDNSDAINTLVADKINSGEATGRSTALVTGLNEQRSKLADLITVYNQTPSKAGFQEIKATLNEIEKTLAEIGVPLPQVNKLLGDYTKKVRDLQGKGLAPLDLEIPTAEKLNPAINAFEKFGGIASKVTGQLGGLFKGFLLFQGLNFVQSQLSQIGSQAFETSLRFESLQKTIEFSSGGAVEGGKNLAFIRTEVDRLSTPLESSVRAFTQLNATTRKTALEGQATKDIFTALSQAALVFGLSSEQIDRANTAIAQIASKGTVSMEELRGQLSEAIPGATQIAARSLGLTERELFKLVETGQLASSDFLPKFAAQLSSETAGGVAGAANTGRAAINRLSNSVTELQLSIAGATNPATIGFINALSGSIKFLSNNADTIKNLFIVLGLTGVVALGNIVKASIIARGGLFAVGFAAGTAISAFTKLALQTAVFTLGIDAATSAFKVLFKQSGDGSDFADKMVNSFNRIKQAANDTPDLIPKFKPPSQGFFDDFGRFFGERPTLSSFIPGVGTLVTANRLSNRVQTGKADFFSLGDKVATDRRVAYSEGLITSQNINERAQQFIGTDGKNLTAKNELAQVIELDKEINRLGALKSALPKNATKDYAALQAKLDDLAKKRKAVGAIFLTTNQELAQSISLIENQLANEADPQVRSQLESTLSTLKKTQEQLNKVQQTDGAVDIIKKFAQTMSGLADAFEQVNRESEQFLNQQKLIANQELSKNFTTDPLADRKAAKTNIANEKTALERQLAGRQRIEADVREKLDNPLFKDVYKSANISETTTIEELKRKSKDAGTDPGGAKVKQAIDALIVVREEEEKTAQLRVQLSDTVLKAQQQASQDALFEVERNNSIATASQTQSTEKRIESIRKLQREGVLAEGAAANEINKIQVKSAKETLANQRKQLADLRSRKGTISAAEFETAERNLLSQIASSSRGVEDSQLQADKDAVNNVLSDIEQRYARNQSTLEGLRARGIVSEEEYNQDTLRLAQERANADIGELNKARRTTTNPIRINEINAKIGEAYKRRQEAISVFYSSEEQREIAHGNTMLAINEAALARGAVTEEEFNKRRFSQTEANLNAQLGLIRSQIAETPVGNTKELDNLRTKEASTLKAIAENRTTFTKDQNVLIQAGLDEAARVVKASETQREIDVQKFVNANNNSVDIQIEAEKRRIDSKIKSNKQEAEIEKKRLDALKKQKFTNPKDQREQQLAIEASQQKILDLALASVQLESQAQDNAKKLFLRNLDEKVLAQKIASNRNIDALEAEKAAQQSLLRSIDNQSNLLKSEAELAKSRDSLNEFRIESGVNSAKSALEIRKRLDEKDLNPQVAQVLRSQLAQLTGNANASELDIITQKQQREDALAASKLQSLNAQQAIERSQLQLDIQRNQIASNQAVLEARIAELKAQQAESEVVAALAKARNSGDSQLVKEQLAALSIAQRISTLATQQRSEAEAQAQVQQKINKNSLNNLGLQQELVKEQFNSTEADRQRNKALELVEATVGRISDKAGRGEKAIGTRERRGFTSNDSLFNTSKFAGFMQRFKGGDVVANQPYLVGENSDGSINPTTELFIPNTAGRILNAEDTGRLLLPTISKLALRPLQTTINVDNNPVVKAISSLQKTIESRRPLQENTFHLVETDNSTQKVLDLHRRLLFQKI